VELKTLRVPVSAANAALNLPKQTNNRSQPSPSFLYPREGKIVVAKPLVFVLYASTD
jgi:hypothetical protein